MYEKKNISLNLIKCFNAKFSCFKNKIIYLGSIKKLYLRYIKEAHGNFIWYHQHNFTVKLPKLLFTAHIAKLIGMVWGEVRSHYTNGISKIMKGNEIIFCCNVC